MYLNPMEIQQIPIEQITPYAQNNRKHGEQQVERISKSISDFGFNQPLVLDELKTVLVGHGRLLAAQRLGIGSLPCLIVKGLTEAKKRAYRILDNKLQNDSEWDFEALGLELGFLEEQGFDLEGWGLDDLKDLFPIEEGEVYEDDGGGEVPEETYLKTGDLIELGPHRLLCGDSTKSEDVELLLNNSVPFIMVTDPPYGVEYDPEWRLRAGINKSHQTLAHGLVSNDERADWTEAYRLFPGSVAYVWHEGRHSADLVINLRDADFMIRSQIIWAKPSLVMSRGHYHWQHEPCWYAVKEGISSKWCGDRTQSTVWQIANMHRTQGSVDDGKTIHSTQKPIECMARPIRNHGDKKDDVYDPFLGSGTTLIAADQLNRVCYGMEIDPKYCQVILERYQKHCSKVGKPFICRINGKEFKPQA